MYAHGRGTQSQNVSVLVCGFWERGGGGWGEQSGSTNGEGESVFSPVCTRARLLLFNEQNVGIKTEKVEKKDYDRAMRKGLLDSRKRERRDEDGQTKEELKRCKNRAHTSLFCFINIEIKVCVFLVISLL